MTIWTDLQAAIEAKITALGYTGTLANLGIDQPYSPDLVTLLELQAQLGAISGGGTMAVTGTFWQTTQPVSIASLPVLAAGTNAIGSITNTSFGISGTLPAFASTPTINIGTAPNLTITNTAFTANAGTNLNTSTLAIESGGNLAGINTKLPASLGAKVSSASLSVTQAFAATSTLANVASSATSVSLLAANNNRKTAIIINDSTSDLYVTLNASAASTTNYSLFLAAKVGNTPSFLAINGDDYSGEIRGIWSSANGFARITEVV